MENTSNASTNIALFILEDLHFYTEINLYFSIKMQTSKIKTQYNLNISNYAIVKMDLFDSFVDYLHFQRKVIFSGVLHEF